MKFRVALPLDTQSKCNQGTGSHVKCVLIFFHLLFHRMDAVMEKDRLLALEKERAKEEEKKRFVLK